MTLVLLAHGSPDRRHAETVERLAVRVSRRRGSGAGEVHHAYLDHDDPRPHALAPRLEGRVTVVPLLLTPAFHARVDVPAGMDALSAGGARVCLAEPVGGHPALVTAVAERLSAGGHDPDGHAVLVAGGSSDGQARRALELLLAEHGRAGWRGTVLPEAQRLDGTAPVVPFTLAEGVLHDRVAQLARGADAPFVRGGLADTEALVDVVLDRSA